MKNATTGIIEQFGISAAEVVLTVLHAGGKFDSNSYKVSGGLHGVGVSCVNFLSEWLKVEIWRDGKTHEMEFTTGISVAPLKETGKTTKLGTKITFKPDSSIFEVTEYSFDKLSERLREKAFLNKGIRINIRDEREEEEKKHEFYYKGGIAEFVKHLNKNKSPLHDEPLYFEQIADELSRAGKQVYLSVGPHERPPRRYRGHDFCWWLGVLGLWDAATPAEGKEHVTIAVSGANGGNTVDFRKFAARGMTLVGRTQQFKGGVMHFAPDLARNITNGDANYLSVLNEADAFVARNGLDLPPEPEAHHIGPDPQCVTSPILELNLAEAGITSIIWATGFSVDYSWLQVDAFDAKGKPIHQRGVSPERGIYFLGLPWLSRRGSSFIWGVWHDAKFLADHIATQRGYMSYSTPK